MRLRLPELSRRPWLACAAGASVWILVLFWRLAARGEILATRDVPVFHLPLRLALRSLMAFGMPEWNPFLHGGQPILSSPSYAAFYPLTWLNLAFPADAGLAAWVILHAAIAFAGAWWLAGRLGCNRWACLLAAVAFSGSGAYLSLLGALTLFSGLAWWPWLLGATDAMVAAPKGAWQRSGLAAGGLLALSLLNGEPSTALSNGLGMLTVAVHGGLRNRRTAPRLLLPVALALGLAAVQLAPTLLRLAESPRSRGLAASEATLWSLPPVRLIELALPQLFGDPTRQSEGFFLGWSLNDRNYPYVSTLYPGLPVTLLALTALLRWPIPRRGVWIGLLAVGLFLALGRHNPLFEPLRSTLPLLAVLRFPERFAVLATAVAAMAAALGWHRLMEEREAGRRGPADLPLSLAAVWLATCLFLTGSLYLAPGAARWHVRAHGLPGLSPAREDAVLAWLRGEGWAAVVVAAGTVLLFALCRTRRPARRVLELAALALVAGDLWRFSHRLVQTVPLDTLRPAALLADPAVKKDRVFVLPVADERQLPFAVVGDRTASEVRSSLERLAPYSGLLWNVEYAFNVDFDLTLTAPAQRAASLLERQSARPPAFRRLLGAWNVGTLVVPKPPRRLIAELQQNPRSLPAVAVAHPLVLPRYRFVRRVVFHPDLAAAESAAEAEGFALATADHCLREGAVERAAAYPAPARLLAATGQGDRILLRYRAEGTAFLVAAITWDRAWSARVDGARAPVCRTAIGQLGVELPAGSRRLELRYREPWVRTGGAISLLSLAAAAVLFGRSRRILPP